MRTAAYKVDVAMATAAGASFASETLCYAYIQSFIELQLNMDKIIPTAQVEIILPVT